MGKLTECFKIQLLSFQNGYDIFELRKGTSIYRINCLKPKYRAYPIMIEADPFVFVKDEILYLFYESKQWRKPAVIKMICTKDLLEWTKPVVVLKEPFHLSFPWVFEDKGSIYMIPETAQDKSIRLYKACDKSLSKFELVDKVLVDNHRNSYISFCDTCIVKKENIYYLFTTRQFNSCSNRLDLYMSQSLTGPYTLHPKSPIVDNLKMGRNAGSILEKDGRLLRFSQDCVKRYGDNVHISQIVELNSERFEEKIVRESIIPTDFPFYSEGGHQFNVVKFKNQWIVATDAKEYHGMFIPSILNKLSRILGI